PLESMFQMEYPHHLVDIPFDKLGDIPCFLQDLRSELTLEQSLGLKKVFLYGDWSSPHFADLVDTAGFGHKGQITNTQVVLESSDVVVWVGSRSPGTFHIFTHLTTKREFG